MSRLWAVMPLALASDRPGREPLAPAAPAVAAYARGSPAKSAHRLTLAPRRRSHESVTCARDRMLGSVEHFGRHQRDGSKEGAGGVRRPHRRWQVEDGASGGGGRCERAACRAEAAGERSALGEQRRLLGRARGALRVEAVADDGAAEEAAPWGGTREARSRERRPASASRGAPSASRSSQVKSIAEVRPLRHVSSQVKSRGDVQASEWCAWRREGALLTAARAFGERVHSLVVGDEGERREERPHAARVAAEATAQRLDGFALAQAGVTRSGGQ
jgi:hypothetical protein